MECPGSKVTARIRRLEDLVLLLLVEELLLIVEEASEKTEDVSEASLLKKESPGILETMRVRRLRLLGA